MPRPPERPEHHDDELRFARFRGCLPGRCGLADRCFDGALQDRDQRLDGDTRARPRRGDLDAARTGDVGDGKVFVVPVEKIYRIRTGEQDRNAVTPVRKVVAGMNQE